MEVTQDLQETSIEAMDGIARDQKSNVQNEINANPNSENQYLSATKSSRGDGDGSSHSEQILSGHTQDVDEKNQTSAHEDHASNIDDRGADAAPINGIIKMDEKQSASAGTTSMEHLNGLPSQNTLEDDSTAIEPPPDDLISSQFMDDDDHDEDDHVGSVSDEENERNTTSVSIDDSTSYMEFGLTTVDSLPSSRLSEIARGRPNLFDYNPYGEDEQSIISDVFTDVNTNITQTHSVVQSDIPAIINIHYSETENPGKMSAEMPYVSEEEPSYRLMSYPAYKPSAMTRYSRPIVSDFKTYTPYVTEHPIGYYMDEDEEMVSAIIMVRKVKFDQCIRSECRQINH